MEKMFVTKAVITKKVIVKPPVEKVEMTIDRESLVKGEKINVTIKIS